MLRDKYRDITKQFWNTLVRHLERFLARCKGGYQGSLLAIFMKREFGKKLIKRFANVEP